MFILPVQILVNHHSGMPSGAELHFYQIDLIETLLVQATTS